MRRELLKGERENNMGNKLHLQDYVNIMNIINNEFYSYDENIIYKENDFINDAPAYQPNKHFLCKSQELRSRDNPEKNVILQDSFDNLSTEAKEVIKIILTKPIEISEIFGSPKLKLLTKRSVFLHLTKVFSSAFIAKNIIKEIENWVNQL